MSRILPIVQLLSAALVAAVLAGCGSSDEAPTAEVLSAIPMQLDPALDDADDLTLRVAYTDPNGDLGGGVAEIHDCRIEGLVTRLVLPAIASEQAVSDGVFIEGELTLIIPDVGAVAASAQPAAACRELGVGAPSGDAQSLCVVFVDAAGIAGPGDCTDPIRILPASP